MKIFNTIAAAAAMSMALSTTLSAEAVEVDPQMHKLCVEAKDYAGCIRAMKGEASNEMTVNEIQRQGANLTEGNKCPTGHFSSGGGYCQRVVCIKRGLYGRGHEQGLGGKGNTCKGGAELTWDNNHQPIRASLDKKCPPGDFDIGFPNTCQQAMAKGYYSGYSLGFSIHKQGVTPTPMTLTNKVTKVFGSPAKGKLEVGDKIITLNGLKHSEFKTNLHKPTTVNIAVERMGKTLEFIVTTEYQRQDFVRAKKL